MSQVKDLIEQIKRRLRSSGLTYADVAKKLNVAESTVKRWFATGSFDIERLDDFAAMLQIDVGDLFSIKRKRILQSHFTEDQELELAHNEGLFSVLYLSLSGMTYDDMLANFDLSPAKLQSYLLRLDHLGLIELHSENRIVPLARANTRWIANGPLSEKYGEKIRRDFMNTEFSGERESFWLMSGKASDATLKIFSRKLELLLAEFHDLMELDSELPETEAPSITFFAAHRPWKLPIAQLKRR